jgi:alcohol dehydrogenase (cytochrome c)
MRATTATGAFAAVMLAASTQAQVTFERLLNAGTEPHNWLTYSGTYASQRHTTLTQIRPSNVGELELKWVFQAQSLESFETTPLVVDGVMYLTEAPNTVVAVDARTGRPFWRYQHNPSADARPCCGRVTRGLAMLDKPLFYFMRQLPSPKRIKIEWSEHWNGVFIMQRFKNPGLFIPKILHHTT